MNKFAALAAALSMFAGSLASAESSESVIRGSLSSQVELHHFEVETESMASIALRSEDFDTTLTVLSLSDPEDPSSAEFVAFNDDDDTVMEFTTDSFLTALLESGHYLIGVADYMEGASGDYEIEITLRPVAEPVVPSLSSYSVDDIEPFKELIPSFMMMGGMGVSLEGEEAPAFDLSVMMGSDEERISLASLEGKVVVLDFWATWCAPCLAALPSIEQLHKDHADNPDLVILGIVDEPEMMVRTVVDRMELTFPQLDDADMAVNMAYQVTSIPRTVIIGRDGIVAHDFTGFHGEDHLASIVTDLLAEASDSE